MDRVVWVCLAQRVMERSADRAGYWRGMMVKLLQLGEHACMQFLEAIDRTGAHRAFVLDDKGHPTAMASLTDIIRLATV